MQQFITTIISDCCIPLTNPLTNLLPGCPSERITTTYNKQGGSRRFEAHCLNGNLTKHIILSSDIPEITLTAPNSPIARALVRMMP
jgi:hypothetical protein